MSKIPNTKQKPPPRNTQKRERVPFQSCECVSNDDLNPWVTYCKKKNNNNKLVTRFPAAVCICVLITGVEFRIEFQVTSGLLLAFFLRGRVTASRRPLLCEHGAQDLVLV